jgi:hypothetical protein
MRSSRPDDDRATLPPEPKADSRTRADALLERDAAATERAADEAVRTAFVPFPPPKK